MTTTPSITDIKDAFIYKASDFKLDANHPSRTEIQELFRKLEENALAIACLEPECYEFGFATLICKLEDWNNYNADRLTKANQTAAINAALLIDPAIDISTVPYVTIPPTDSMIPALPSFPNPGKFTFADAWSDKRRTTAKIIHEQTVDAYLHASNVNQALTMLLREIVNETLWADLNKGSSIGSTTLRNRHTVRQLREHLENKFHKHRPVDIESLMTIFNTQTDTSLPIETYFEHQQQCQDQLKDTDEPISDFTMKRMHIRM